MGSNLPSRKWWANLVTVLSGWFIAVIQNGWAISDSLWIMLVTILSTAVVTWLVPNTDAKQRRAGS